MLYSQPPLFFGNLLVPDGVALGLQDPLVHPPHLGIALLFQHLEVKSGRRQSTTDHVSTFKALNLGDHTYMMSTVRGRDPQKADEVKEVYKTVAQCGQEGGDPKIIKIRPSPDVKSKFHQKGRGH